MSKKQPKVILTEHLSEEAARWLEARVELVRQPHDEPAKLRAALKEAAGLVVRTYTQVDEQLLRQAPKLKVVGRAGVGLDNIDLAACGKRGVTVVYTPDANTQAVVEYVAGLMLDAVRPRPIMQEYVPPPKFHAMRSQFVGRQLDTMVLGIVGMGRIGRRVADVAHAIGMRVLYNDLLTRRQLRLSDEDTSEFVDKATLYREADIVTIHVDGRADNRKMIDAKALEQMKRSVLFINAARGMLIDNEALAAWAKANADHGAMAYLDVHEPEPPADDYVLFGLDNVKLLPHLASRTPQAMANMSWVVRDVVKVLEGKKPKWPAG